MSDPKFQSNSINWSFRQIFQRGREWFEHVTLRRNRSGSSIDWSLPDWLVRILFWCLVVAIALWIGWRLLLVLEQAMKRWRARRIQTLGDRVRADGTDWPVPVWLQRAQTLQQQGKYAEACRALYMALLQLLDDRNWVSHRDSRSNGEYLQSLRQYRPQNAYRRLIDTHDRSHFGETLLSGTDFQHCSDSFQAIQNATSQQATSPVDPSPQGSQSSDSAKSSD